MNESNGYDVQIKKAEFAHRREEDMFWEKQGMYVNRVTGSVCVLPVLRPRPAE